MHIIDIVKTSMKEINVKPKIKPIRGGTDGARLSFMGLPCPNIFAGGHNFHGRFEYIPVQSMEKAHDLIVKIIENVAK
jgi:tripeptide aminopeptidase